MGLIYNKINQKYEDELIVVCSRKGAKSYESIAELQQEWCDGSGEMGECRIAPDPALQYDGQKHMVAVYKNASAHLGGTFGTPIKVSRTYSSLAELNEEWEDAPEAPRAFYYIASEGHVVMDNDTVTKDFADDLRAIGNYFETEEEAEEAVKKLKAWERLRDKGFRFVGWKNGKLEYPDYVSFWCEDYEGCGGDLDLIFGGGE